MGGLASAGDEVSATALSMNVAHAEQITKLLPTRLRFIIVTLLLLDKCEGHRDKQPNVGGGAHDETDPGARYHIDVLAQRCCWRQSESAEQRGGEFASLSYF